MLYHNIYNSWSWIGGHADGMEDLCLVALRELQEETGVENAVLVSREIYSLETLTVNGHVKKGNLCTESLGQLVVSDIISFEKDLSENDLLSMVASAESKSEHPLGKAIVVYAQKKKIPILKSYNFKMASGKGIYAEVFDKQLHCGNERFFNENGITINNNIQTKLEGLRKQEKALVLVADGKKCIGVRSINTYNRSVGA